MCAAAPPPAHPPTHPPRPARLACAGFLGIDQQQCEQQGCCWASASFQDAPPVDLPWCFSANAGASAYRVTELRRQPGARGGGEVKATGCFPNSIDQLLHP